MYVCVLFDYHTKPCKRNLRSKNCPIRKKKCDIYLVHGVWQRCNDYRLVCHSIEVL